MAEEVWATLSLASRASDGCQDGLVAGTPADVALHIVDDLRVARIRLLVEQALGSQKHAGCTEAALEGVLSNECLLQWMQLTGRSGQALYGEYLAAPRFVGEQGAGTHRQTVQQDSARPA